MKIGDRCFIHGYIDEIRKDTVIIRNNGGYFGTDPSEVITGELPSAQPDPRYTEEELRVFQHGISLSLLSKRSAQHWQYDKDTATEIEFLERLYDKVGADMRGEQDDESRSNSNAQTDTRARGMGATDKSSGI